MPDEEGMVSPAERKSYGWLGKPPDELWEASKHFQDKWKKLNRLCKYVAKMWDRERRLDYAKEIELERELLVRDIKREARSKKT